MDVRRLVFVVGLALLVSSCRSDEAVDTTLSLESATTTADVAATIAPTTGTTTGRSPSTTSALTTIRSSESGEEGIGRGVVVTTPEDPALDPEALLGVVFRDDIVEAVVPSGLGGRLPGRYGVEAVFPAGFEVAGGQCAGTPGDDFCSYVLHFAESLDDSETAGKEWVTLFSHTRGRDEAGTPVWQVVDALYVEFPSGHDLAFHPGCWAKMDTNVLGVVEGGYWGKVRPLRAWYADWETETITEIPVTSDIHCWVVPDQGTAPHPRTN